QEDLQQVRLVQVVRKNIELQLLVLEHFVCDLEDPIASGEAEPLVFLVERVLLSLVVLAGDFRSIEEQVCILRFELGFESEVMDEGLRLRKPARKSESYFAFREWFDVDGDRRTERVINRKQGAFAVEVSWRHRVFVWTKEWRYALL